jgi:hypothetical protein
MIAYGRNTFIAIGMHLIAMNALATQDKVPIELFWEGRMIWTATAEIVSMRVTSGQRYLPHRIHIPAV